MDVFLFTDIIGIIAFSLSGFLVGVRNRLDLLGIVIAASLTALGGGILRDVLLHRTPFAFSEYYPAATLLITIIIAFAFQSLRADKIEHKWLFVVSDTIGLIAFSITGALLAIDADYNVFGVIILSFLTAVGGGVTRDVMINQVPSVLVSDFYGSIALIVGIMLAGLNAIGLMSDLAVMLVGLGSIVLRLVAYRQKWQLPKISAQ
ncbi:trimeric intracellular cation channel family protein [Sulfurimonas sp. HSL3-7]|uniref:trimeric intracellular cation channel family protein n=1 Tax=Sulfonitrofixus jiaomeiensis TaxID=3131938 RepID=UPI0031F8C34A